MRIAFYGSSLLSSYWNGAATYYRGLLSGLAQRGYEITFYEPDAFDRQANRDIEPPPWARVHVYAANEAAVRGVLAEAAEADIVIKASGVGVFDDALLSGAIANARPDAIRVFWDVDAPATLAEMQADPAHPVRQALPALDLVLTYGGGPPVIDTYTARGARSCIPIYNALDPETHHPVPVDPDLQADLSFLANRMPDREARARAFFLEPADRLPQKRFLLGGSGWHDAPISPNVRLLGHVGTNRHNAFNVSARAVLNVARDSMAATGYCPATRVFEATGAGACLITDFWEGIEDFLKPDEEILVARDGNDVVDLLAGLTVEQARRIGDAARRRVLADHTYTQRAAVADAVFRDALARKRGGLTVRIVFLGLSLSSSWGNGHATTYRALLKGLTAAGHDVMFLERNQPWYAENRDLPRPDFCDLHIYDSPGDLAGFTGAIADADAVIIGSYVPDAPAVITWAREHHSSALCFYDIDTPITLAGLASGGIAYLTPALVPFFDIYFSFTGGPALRILENHYGARQAVALYCSVDADQYRPLDRPRRWDLGYLGTYSPDRQPTLDRLLLEPARRAPDRRFVVAGPQYPADIDWPANVERIEHLPPAEHPAFYASLGWTLNVTRADMIRSGYSPSVRLFEATACGVPVVSDRWAGIEDAFTPGAELLIVDTAEDILALPEDRRDAIGAAGRARTLRQHTGRQRAAELANCLAGAARTS